MRKIKPEKIDALRALVTGAFGSDDNAEEVAYLEGQTPPSKEEIDAKFKELQTDYNAKQYQRDRINEYPDLQECIHAILDGELTALQKKRSAVKDKFPKPE
jgi:hypothetical protein